MSGMPEPQPGLPYGTTDDDVNALWAADCPMCEGLGYVPVPLSDTREPSETEREPCPNCKGQGGVEIPF